VLDAKLEPRAITALFSSGRPRRPRGIVFVFVARAACPIDFRSGSGYARVLRAASGGGFDRPRATVVNGNCDRTSVYTFRFLRVFCDS